MNVEELSKTQILLLAILVSFVTAIATGILTVSLLSQASPNITQTINRVVERTVERVVPQEVPTTGAPVSVKETTVVVNEQDLITDAIAKMQKSMIRLKTRSEFERKIGAGVSAIVIGGKGYVVADATQINSRESYVIDAGNDVSFDLDFVTTDNGLAILKTTSGNVIEGTSPVAFADASALRLGQSVIAVSGASRVATGIIASFPGETAESKPFIETTIAAPAIGGPLVNIFGEFVGMNTQPARNQGSTVYQNAKDVQASVEAASQ